MALRMIPAAGTAFIRYGGLELHPHPDGTVAVPGFAVPEALQQGATFADTPVATLADAAGKSAPAAQALAVDVRQEIENAEDWELNLYLQLRGKPAFYYEKNRHLYSDHLRQRVAVTCPHCRQPHAVDGAAEIFTDGDLWKTALTVAPGSLDFTVASAAGLLVDMAVTSAIVPAGTRIANITDYQNGRGTLRLPAGAERSAVTGGSDPDASFIVSETLAKIADYMDDYHGRFHKDGRGRRVFYTDAEKRAQALALHDAEAAAATAAAKAP